MKEDRNRSEVAVGGGVDAVCGAAVEVVPVEEAAVAVLAHVRGHLVHLGLVLLAPPLADTCVKGGGRSVRV